MPKVLDIAICGAGPAGLATALYLQRLGHNPVVLERFDAPKPIGSGLILQPTGQAVLHDLGLLPAVVALGSPIDRLCGIDARSGRMVLDVGYKALPKLGRGLGIHRAALFDVLHDAVRAARSPIRTSSEIVTLRDAAAGKRTLVLTGDQQSEGFDLVVDCLGAGSPLKSHSRAPGKSRPLTFGAIWATLPWHGAGFDPGALLQRYRAASVMAGVLPIGQSSDGAPLAALFWSLKAADYEALKRDGLDAWKRVVLENWPETLPYLDAIADFETMTLARYVHHTMADPTGDGLVFVGDSAHSTSPQLGQGANMALLDARALYVGLRDKDDDLEGALGHYAGLRRNHVRLYQALSAMFTPFYQSDSHVLPVIRDVFVSALARVPPAPQFLAAMVSGALLSPIRKLGLEQPPRV
ncbi:MAG: glutamate synthase [Devosia sp.]|uniref:FAD-dependent oxidoreductase n=1 Tax=Devosia sp. TaxID=1871048 RepID=UPI00261DA844|nr:NAD(P)/FAD-dependent oxidoreductase [Devosia sp.]MDB5527756.1 glutamate synthase [Devosia sp.]